jgi:hypothetical protein
MTMKNLACFVALAGVGACTPPPTSTNNQIEATVTNMEARADEYEKAADATLAKLDPSPSPTSSNWSYSEQKDEMRGAVTKTARVSATKPIHLDFPYGESTPELVIRQDPKFGFDIYVTANGQFLCRSYDDDVVSVKFDSGPITSWACAEADGGSSDIVFISNGRSFLAKLKKAKKVIIEADMYEAGRQQMTFDVGGLEWK